jgi:hypothetical protein
VGEQSKRSPLNPADSKHAQLSAEHSRYSHSSQRHPIHPAEVISVDGVASWVCPRGVDHHWEPILPSQDA